MPGSAHKNRDTLVNHHDNLYCSLVKCENAHTVDNDSSQDIYDDQNLLRDRKADKIV